MERNIRIHREEKIKSPKFESYKESEKNLSKPNQ